MDKISASASGSLPYTFSEFEDSLHKSNENFENLPKELILPRFTKLKDHQTKVDLEEKYFKLLSSTDSERSSLEDSSDSNDEFDYDLKSNNFLEFNKNRALFESSTKKDLIDILTSFIFLIAFFYRFHVIFDSYYLSESHLTIKKYLINYFSLIEDSLNSKQLSEKILNSIFDYYTNQKAHSLGNFSKVFMLLGVPSVKFKLFQNTSTSCKNFEMPFDNLFEMNPKPKQFCKLDDISEVLELKNKTICDHINYVYGAGSFSREQYQNLSTLSKIVEYLNNLNCTDMVDESTMDCEGYHITYDNHRAKRDTLIKCILQKNILSIKIELNFFNNSLKQIIYAKIVIMFFISSGKRFAINVDIISPDRMLLLFNPFRGRHPYLRIAMTLIIFSIFIYKSRKLVDNLRSKQRMAKKLNYFNLLDLLFVVLMLFWITSEMQLIFTFSNDLKSLFKSNKSYISLYNASKIVKRCELLTGLINVLVCLMALGKCSFTQVITQIIVTFKRCAADLIGFFCVFICLVISYALELNFMLGAEFVEYSTVIRSFAKLFSFVWGDIDYLKLNAYDRRSYYLFASYLIFMIIIMFNLMLAIILGTYDAVKNDPTCRDAQLKVYEYFTILIERYLKILLINRFPKLFKRFDFLKTNQKLFCIKDVERRFLKSGFTQQQIDVLFKKHNLKLIDQIDKFKLEVLTRNLFQLEFNSRPKLRINDHTLAGDYVSESEWKNMIGFYNQLESYFSLYEKRLDVVYDAISLNLSRYDN